MGTMNSKKREIARKKKHCSCDQAHSVLAMKHNEIDEGNNLTDVGHSTTNVDGAKWLLEALDHVQWWTEGACFALVHIHGLVDGNTHVCDVGCHHAHIYTTLHTVADSAFSDQQSSAISDSLISQDTDLGGGQLWRSSGTCGRTQRSSSCNLSQAWHQACDASRANGIHVDAQGTIGSCQGQLCSKVSYPSTQDGTVHLASQLRLTVTRCRASANDGIDVITHTHCWDKCLQNVEGAFRTSSKFDLLSLAESFHLSDGGKSIQLADVVLLPVVLNLVTCLHHGLHHSLISHGLVVLHCLNQLFTGGADGWIKIQSGLALQSSNVAAAAAEAIRRQGKNAHTNHHSSCPCDSHPLQRGPLRMERLINLGVADIIHAIEIGHAHRQKGAAQQPTREFGRALKAKMAYWTQENCLARGPAQGSLLQTQEHQTESNKCKVCNGKNPAWTEIGCCLFLFCVDQKSAFLSRKGHHQQRVLPEPFDMDCREVGGIARRDTVYCILLQSWVCTQYSLPWSSMSKVDRSCWPGTASILSWQKGESILATSKEWIKVTLMNSDLCQLHFSIWHDLPTYWE